MGTCVSRPCGNTSDKRQAVSSGESQPLPPHTLGGRRSENRTQFTDIACGQLPSRWPSTVTTAPVVNSVRPSCISVNGDDAVSTSQPLPSFEEAHSPTLRTYSPQSPAQAPQADLSQSKTQKTFIESSLFLSFRGDLSTMSDSGTTRTLLRSSRTVSFAPSVISFTQVPQAPPSSPVTSVPTPMCDWSSCAMWEALRVELRAVALQQLDLMILSASRSHEPLSSEIIDAFIELETIDAMAHASCDASELLPLTRPAACSGSSSTSQPFATEGTVGLFGGAPTFEVTALVDGHVHSTQEKKLRRKTL